MVAPLSYEYERDDYYCYPDSNVLKNKLGIKDEKTLTEAERELTALKLAEFEKSPSLDEFNFEYLRNIHRHLFGEIYEWAGKNRKIDISRGNIFCMHELIDVCMNQMMDELKNENFLEGLDKDKLIKRLAYYLGEINTIHPFREGNGRVQRAFIRELARRNGYKLSFDKITSKEMIEASDKTFNHDYEMMEELLKRAMV